jgi:hypothetical protein
MQDAALFFRSRAVSSFHRRRKHPVLSDEWRRQVEDRAGSSAPLASAGTTDRGG